jgi:hypothetical protein
VYQEEKMKKQKSHSTKKPSRRKEKAERMQKVVEATGMSKKTLQNLFWLTRRIRPELRGYVEKLSYKHLAAVATLNPVNQKAVLDAAIENKWTAEYTGSVVRGMKSEIKGNDDWARHEMEKIKSQLKKIADEYRGWDILEDVVKAIDEFVASEIIYKPTPTDTPPTADAPPTPEKQ